MKIFLSIFLQAIILLLVSCSNSQSSQPASDSLRLKDENLRLEEARKQKRIADSIEANTMRLLDKATYPISDRELIKLFNISPASLGDEFINMAQPEIKPGFEITGKKFYMIGPNHYLLSVMGITNPNDYHTSSGSANVGLFRYEDGSWNRLDVFKNVPITGAFGGYGSIEKFFVFGKQNVGFSLTGSYTQMGYTLSNRCIIGVFENKLLIIYQGASAEFSDGSFGEVVNKETSIEFVDTSQPIFELKEIFKSHNRIKSSRTLTFDYKEMKYK